MMINGSGPRTWGPHSGRGSAAWAWSAQWPQRQPEDPGHNRKGQPGQEGSGPERPWLQPGLTCLSPCRHASPTGLLLTVLVALTYMVALLYEE